MSSPIYQAFLDDLSAFFRDKPDLVSLMLTNVFSMRIIGNKTHGDLAEVAMAHFVTRYVPRYCARHVGKDLYRAKTCEEDIAVTTPSGESLPVSLKAYGDGPLQLSTNKDSSMYAYLQKQPDHITDPQRICSILESPAFVDFHRINVLPLIYDEKRMRCNIMFFDTARAMGAVRSISLVTAGKGRTHPIYRFTDSDGGYICEVRYGDQAANALQRGLWTHTKNALSYFRSLTGGWITYAINKTVIELVGTALVATTTAQAEALQILEASIAPKKMG